MTLILFKTKYMYMYDKSYIIITMLLKSRSPCRHEMIKFSFKPQMTTNDTGNQPQR